MSSLGPQSDTSVATEYTRGRQPHDSVLIKSVNIDYINVSFIIGQLLHSHTILTGLHILMALRSSYITNHFEMTVDLKIIYSYDGEVNNDMPILGVRLFLA